MESVLALATNTGYTVAQNLPNYVLTYGMYYTEKEFRAQNARSIHLNVYAFIFRMFDSVLMYQ